MPKASASRRNRNRSRPNKANGVLTFSDMHALHADVSVDLKSPLQRPNQRIEFLVHNSNANRTPEFSCLALLFQYQPGDQHGPWNALGFRLVEGTGFLRAPCSGSMLICMSFWPISGQQRSRSSSKVVLTTLKSLETSPGSVDHSSQGEWAWPMVSYGDKAFTKSGSRAGRRPASKSTSLGLAGQVRSKSMFSLGQRAGRRDAAEHCETADGIVLVSRS